MRCGRMAMLWVVASAGASAQSVVKLDAQGAAAEIVAAVTILFASVTKAPVSTTYELSSGVAGTMVANGTGIRPDTARRILLAWCMTLPGTMILSGIFFIIGKLFVR